MDFILFYFLNAIMLPPSNYYKKITNSLMSHDGGKYQVKQCPCCHKQTAGTFPVSVTKTTQYGSTIKSIVVYMMQRQISSFRENNRVSARYLRSRTFRRHTQELDCRSL